MLDDDRKFIMKKRAFEASVEWHDDESEWHESAWNDDEWWHGDGDQTWYCNEIVADQSGQRASVSESLSAENLQMIADAVVQAQNKVQKVQNNASFGVPEHVHGMAATVASPAPGSAAGVSPSITQQLLARANASASAAPQNQR